MDLDKCEKVLANLLKSSFEIKNDCYLESLFSHIKQKYGDSERLRSQCQAWVPKSLLLWQTETLTPKTQVATFTLKVLSLMVADEKQFLILKDVDIFHNIEIGFQKHPKLKTASVKLAHVVLLKAIAQHTSGLQWIKLTKQWKTTYYEDSHTVYVIRETHDFIYTILVNFLSDPNQDDEQCVEILKYFMAVLLERPWSSEVLVDDDLIKRQNLPMLNLVCYILEKCIESGERSRIAYHILITCKFDFNLWKLAQMSHDQSFLGHVLRGFVLSNFAKFSCIPDDVDPAVNMPLEKFVLNFYNYMNFCIQRRSSRNIIRMAEMNHQLWKKLGDRAPLELMKTHKIKFGDQILLLQLLPIIYVIQIRRPQDREYLDEFSLRLFKISCEFTTRLVYSFRDLLSTNAENVPDLAYKSIQGILAMGESLSRERAIIVFQALVYTLKQFTPDICVAGEKATVDMALLTEIPNLLSAIITGLYELIKNYRLTWNECFETTTLVNFMLAFLNNPNLSPRLSVQALKLTQLSIEHFLAPNLALLLDTLQGSGMENLGPMIYKRLHDLSWETRDSTLELLCSMVEISEIKFPAFQKHILSNGICPIVTSMAKNDHEPYVRASAHKCLTAMVKIDLFWEQNLAEADVVGLILSVLVNEDEGVVRREAICTLISVYSYKDIPEHYLDRVFSTMAYCATNDLYWEVKVNALIFWKSVLCKQLHLQGMVDNQFPTVIFSKELKKIVTLNEKEISTRLHKVMVKLAARGFLGVLLTCLNDDSDLEVAKMAVQIIQKLLECLRKYNYLEQYSGLKIETVIPLDSDGIENLKETNVTSPLLENGVHMEESDAVIESIVNSTDINLLSLKYQKDLSLHGDGSGPEQSIPAPQIPEEKIEACYYKIHAKVTVQEFLTSVTTSDLNEIVENRSSWLSYNESFESLLDDILSSVQDPNDMEINDADCY